MTEVRGKVWLVGAGPGDPGLLTLRGAELLGEADVVLHDALSHEALLEHCSGHTEIRDVGKRYGVRSPHQSTITAQLIELALGGKRVVRLKGGDPLLFARGGEEAQALADAGIPFEIVPGISSPVGAAGYAGMTLTHRHLSSSVTFITGSDREEVEWSPDAWRKLATATDTICVLMGMRRIEEITEAIVAGGRDPATPAAVIHWATRPQQCVVEGTLGTIAAAVREAGVANPAVIIVGEVVTLRRQLAWYDSQPLFGRRLLIPRPRHQALATARAVRLRGAEPVVLPTIEIRDPEDRTLLDRGLAELATYDWVLFTSANGVDRFFDALAAAGRDARALGNARVGVIGPKTGAAVRRRGIVPDVVAKEFIGEGLAREIVAAGAPTRVLIPRAKEAREALPEALRAAGAEVLVVPVYETHPVSGDDAAALRAAFTEGAVDVVTFTSSSTVTSLLEALGSDARELLSRVTVASIGPITSQTVRDAGLPVAVEATEYTVAGLLDALEAHYAAEAAGAAPPQEAPPS